MVLETHMKLCEIYLDFPENCVLIAKLGKWTKNRPKTRFFEFIKNFGDWFRLNLFYNENLYYLLCSCTNPIFGKNVFLRYGPKCSQPIRLQEFLVNHISWVSYWNSLIFCMLIQIHINEKLIKNFLGGHGTQSKILGGFVTFYPIHFGHFKCGRHWGYAKYCYSKPAWKDYTIKPKRNGVMRLPNYLDI